MCFLRVMFFGGREVDIDSEINLGLFNFFLKNTAWLLGKITVFIFLSFELLC